jgi:ribosomal protein S18 acetylase RimI-like enzyme
MKSAEKLTIRIREGTQSDNDGLINLTSLTSMKGKISIRVDRKPDFFRLLEMRGHSFVMVAESNNQIIGSYSVSAMPVYFLDVSETAYYLSDFRVHPAYRKSKVALELTEAVILKLQSLHANLLFSIVMSGNVAVSSFLKGSSNWPAAKVAGLFNAYQIIPTTYKPKNSKYLVVEADSDSSCIEFFNNFAKKFSFSPVLSESSFDNTILLTASVDNELVAAICLSDVSRQKQEVLTSLPFFLKNVIVFTNFIRMTLSMNKLPEISENVKVLYIKSFACKPDHKAALKLLLSRARNIAYEKQYHFLTIGIHEKNPWKKVFANCLKFNVQSNLFVANLIDDKDVTDQLVNGVSLFDYSLV